MNIKIILTLQLVTIFLSCSDLSKYSKNIYSQFGEDGIIEKIFEIIKPKSRWCAECGANDGISCSNVCNLWKNQGWNAILIEYDKKFFEKLTLNTKGYKTININKLVDIHLNSLDSFIYRYTKECDLLSIDIDGNDYYLFESLNKIRPRIIIFEFNHTLPPYIDIRAKYDKNNKLGCSLLSIVKLAQKKKYTLIALTETNAIFIVNEEINKLSNFNLPEIRNHTKFLKYLISDYTGKYTVIGEFPRMPWGIKTKFDLNDKSIIINGAKLYQQNLFVDFFKKEVYRSLKKFLSQQYKKKI